MSTPESTPGATPADHGPGGPGARGTYAAPALGGPAAGYGATQGYGATAGHGTPGAGPGGWPEGYGAPGAYGTPPAGDGRPPLASWPLRVGATLLDFLIVQLPILAVQLVAGAAHLRAIAALAQVASLGAGVYLAYMTGTRGYTPGKKIVGIRVLRESDGQLLGAWIGIGRQFLHIVDAIPCYLGLLWPLWDAKKQTFADKLVHSVVVKV